MIIWRENIGEIIGEMMVTDGWCIVNDCEATNGWWLNLASDDRRWWWMVSWFDGESMANQCFRLALCADNHGTCTCKCIWTYFFFFNLKGGQQQWPFLVCKGGIWLRLLNSSSLMIFGRETTFGLYLPRNLSSSQTTMNHDHLNHFNHCCLMKFGSIIWFSSMDGSWPTKYGWFMDYGE